MRIIAKILSGTCAIVGAGGICLTTYALVIKAQAESLLTDVKVLSVGSSTESDVVALTKKHARFLIDSYASSDGAINTTFRIQNRWLAFFKLEPPAEFGASVGVTDGRVYHISAWLMRAMPIYPTFGGSAGMVDEYLEYPESRFGTGRYGHYSFPTPIGKPYLRVLLDSHATPNERQHAFGFQFTCFIKPGNGCDLPCDYLPAAWQDYSSPIGSSDAFDRYYPNRTRCKK